MRTSLLLALAVFTAITYANEPVFDNREAEDQFTQATQDAQLIERACTQTLTDRKTCYQRVAPITAQCRDQLKQQYLSRGLDSLAIDREQKLVDLSDCVQQTSKDSVSR